MRTSAVVHTADELLPVAQRLIDDETQAFERDPTVAVSCRANCNRCCEHAVVVTPAEHRQIATAVTALADDTRDRITHRAAEVAARIDATDVDLGRPGFSRQYYEMAEPCPLLVDGACVVRDARPLVCRNYLMSSPPEACDDRTLEHAVRIQRRRRVPATFADISSSFGDAEPQLLVHALLTSPPAASEHRRSGLALPHC